MEGFMVISKVRTGMKREFAFALKSRNEIAGSLGSTRTRKPPTGLVQEIPDQRPKRQAKENNLRGNEMQELYRDQSDDESNGDSGISYESDDVGLAPNKGYDVANKVVLKNVKDLLRTGFLEGLLVVYRRGVQRHPESSGFPGVVSGVGIKCFCHICKKLDHKPISPNAFELHAGSRNKRPADHIFLHNGKSLREVLNACLETRSQDLEVTISKACGIKASDLNTSYVVEAEETLKSVEEDKESEDSASDILLEEPVRKSVIRKHFKRHKLVLENNNVLPEKTFLFYNVRGKNWLVGYKKEGKILCMCCEKKVSPSQFEAHAGWGCNKQPYHHIFTSEGASLYSLAMSVSGKHELDEVCNICKREGCIVFCSGCSRVFHQDCVHPKEIPWYCRSCRYQKHNVVGYNAINTMETEIDGKERRCMRLPETEESMEPDRGGCFLCRLHDFVKEGFGPRTILICDQCEREYHVGCLKKFGWQDLKELPQGNWFCCNGCEKISSKLQQLIEEGGRQIPGSLLNLILEKQAENDSKKAELDVQWLLLSGKMSNLESVNQLLSDATSIFHEQFSPIVIPGSKTDLIPCMVFGRNLEDKDFGGMYCAVLTVNSQVVSAGVLRVYGTKIAELPLVATAKCCQKLGYFQALYSCIENLLAEMEVKHLSLPATNEAKPMWTNKLGFSDFPENKLDRVGRWYQLMPFEGTSMLRKAVPKISE